MLTLFLVKISASNFLNNLRTKFSWKISFRAWSCCFPCPPFCKYQYAINDNFSFSKARHEKMLSRIATRDSQLKEPADKGSLIWRTMGNDSTRKRWLKRKNWQKKQQWSCKWVSVFPNSEWLILWFEGRKLETAWTHKIPYRFLKLQIVVCKIH